MDDAVAAYNALVVSHKKELAAKLREVGAIADGKQELYSETGQMGVMAQTKNICLQLADQLDPLPPVE